MKCLYCQEDIQFIRGDVYMCTRCPCDVEYHLGESHSYGTRGNKIIKQLQWMTSHNGDTFQMVIQPSEDIKTWMHSTIIQKVVGNRRPPILLLNCIPWIKPGCSTEEFNRLLEMTNQHPQRGVQMPCHFCQEPLVISAGDLELTAYQRGSIHGTCYRCRSDSQIHHSFQEVGDTYRLFSIWWDVTINQGTYHIYISAEKDKFVLGHTPHASEWEDEVIKLDHVPHITPTNAKDKLKTYLLFL